MNIAGFIYSFVLFIALTPNILFRFPSKGKKTTVAALHSIVFGIIYYFTYSFVMHFSGYNEGINWDPAGAGKAITKAFSPPEVKKAFAPVTAPVNNGYNSVVGKLNNGLSQFDDKRRMISSFNLNNTVNRAVDNAVNKEIAKRAPPGTPPVAGTIGKTQTGINLVNQNTKKGYNLDAVKRMHHR